MSDMLNFLDINLFSIVMLAMIFVVTKIKKDVLSFSSSIFSWIIVFNIAGLLFESLTWIVDGMSSEFAYVMGYMLNMMLILSGPALMGLWTSYVDYQLYSNKKRVHKYAFYQVPTLITLALLVANLFVPIFFEIDRTTHLWRPASLMFIRYLLTYMLYFRVLYLVAINKHHSSHRIISGIMLFLTIPLLGIVIQLIYPTLLLSWSFLALTIIVVYIFLETVSGNHDYLTGVYSRRLMETYIRHKIEEMQDFHLVMTDMDYFKQVNDIYGHHVGDKVLIQFTKALQQSGHQK